MSFPPSQTPDRPFPLTKIIATVGPASAGEMVVGKLIDAGVNIFRFNFSHGTLEEHTQRLKLIRRIAAKRRAPVAILGDLQGPKIRVGPVPEGGIEVKTGATLIVTRGTAMAEAASPDDAPRFTATYANLLDDVEAGQRLLINDGAVRTLIVEKSTDAIICAVTHGGLVTSGKGINLPETDLHLDTLTDRDWRHVAWAVAHDIDMLALSFVRAAGDLKSLRAGIERIQQESSLPHDPIPLVAKIEVPRALDRLEAILEVADGVMVARGDLGVEMDLAQVPVIQKKIILAAQHSGTPCIVATQMFESMIEDAAPTRAEVSDVANAIFDRVDAVMLSGETAVGRYPVVTVEHMHRVALHAEAYLAEIGTDPSPPAQPRSDRELLPALAHGVTTIVQDIGATWIVVWSQDGNGARLLSQNGFHVPILAVTSSDRAARRMQLMRGVCPFLMDPPEHEREFINAVNDHLRHHLAAKRGDRVVIVFGHPLGRAGVTSRLSMHVLD